MPRGPLTLLPKGALTIVRELARHVLKRPVVGVAAFATTDDGRVLLIRRADTGTWCLPGGTLEWGETLRDCLARELREEAGVTSHRVEDVVGAFSRPDRDLRFHAVTLVVRCRVEPPTGAPHNPLEIREARLFEVAAIPRPLAMGMDDIVDIALRHQGAVVE